MTPHYKVSNGTLMHTLVLKDEDSLVSNGISVSPGTNFVTVTFGTADDLKLAVKKREELNSM